MDGKFTLEIEMGNDAMRTRAHLLGALSRLSRSIRGASGYGELSEGRAILDANGNTVGRWEYKREG